MSSTALALLRGELDPSENRGAARDHVSDDTIARILTLAETLLTSRSNSELFNGTAAVIESLERDLGAERYALSRFWIQVGGPRPRRLVGTGLVALARVGLSGSVGEFALRFRTLFSTVRCEECASIATEVIEREGRLVPLCGRCERDLARDGPGR